MFNVRTRLPIGGKDRLRSTRSSDLGLFCFNEPPTRQLYIAGTSLLPPSSIAGIFSGGISGRIELGDKDDPCSGSEFSCTQPVARNKQKASGSKKERSLIRPHLDSRFNQQLTTQPSVCSGKRNTNSAITYGTMIPCRFVIIGSRPLTIPLNVAFLIPSRTNISKLLPAIPSMPS